MNRVPVREGGAKTSDSLERRVTLLTWLVVIQVVLLAALITIQFLPSFDGFGSMTASKEAAGQPGDEMFSEEMSSDQPVVKTEETGNLPPEIPATRPVRIEILNGCGVPKLAAQYADLLRSRGYDVRDTRNADRSNYQNSLIYDRTDLAGQAVRLADLLGISTSQVTDNPNSQLVDVDLTLVLGDDHSTFKLQP
ncbi:LytR C-terminal domain-containing protein [bacterium]|nr:LytR C-terminal domain-containing protein [bacterium]